VDQAGFEAATHCTMSVASHIGVMSVMNLFHLSVRFRFECCDMHHHVALSLLYHFGHTCNIIKLGLQIDHLSKGSIQRQRSAVHQIHAENLILCMTYSNHIVYVQTTKSGYVYVMKENSTTLWQHRRTVRADLQRTAHLEKGIAKSTVRPKSIRRKRTSTLNAT
jgi:hypothetical protein